MKLKQRIGRIPDGSQPAVGVSVAVRKISDGSTITTLLSDADGFIDLQANGHYEPFYLYITNQPGGDKFFDSRDARTAGPLNLPELPVALRVFGDGVIRGYGSDLAVSLVSGGPTVSVAAGAANVAGHPFVVYSAVQLSNSRPVSGVRIDRVILRLYPTGSATTPGKAEVALLAGTIDAGAPSLTTTATVHEVSLYQVSVPVAGAITLTDERVYSNEKVPVSDEVHLASASTTSAGGEALTSATVTLVLPRAAVYDVTAHLSALQVSVAASWSLLGTFTGSGSGLAFNQPHQVAVDASGNVYVADNLNNRLIKLDGNGAFVAVISGLTGITGVCVDSSGNIYVTYPHATLPDMVLQKYNSSLVSQWITVYGDVGIGHLSTDGVHVYATTSDDTRVYKRLCSTGAVGSPSSWGSAGSGDGQFTQPFGIVTDGTHVYVSDRLANRIQKFTTSGTFVTKWGSAGTGNGQFDRSDGLALDDSGNVWVADYGNDRLQRFSDIGVYQTSIAQANPVGVDLASGDVLWVSNFDGDTVAKWDETGGGYGQLAIDIGGSVSDYTGFGERVCAVAAFANGTATGPTTLTVRAFGKATSGTLSLQGLVLSATATPRA